MSLTPPARYDPVAKLLHWLIAYAIIGMLALGWTMENMDFGPDKFALIQWHKSIGITILLLALFRLFWRWRHTPPHLPEHMNVFEKFAAESAHILLYILMIGMPFIGWVMVSSSPLNLPTMLYGFIPWPHLPILQELPNKGHISHIATKLHAYLAWVIVVIVVLHAAAAWKHHLINRDDVLTRMAPQCMMRFLNRIRGQK